MNQWTGCNSSLAGNALELARDGGLGSTYHIVPIAPPDVKRQELSSREKKLYGTLNRESAKRHNPRAVSPRYLPTPQTCVPPLATGSTFYQSEKDITRAVETPLMELIRKKTNDPYGVSALSCLSLI